MPQHRMLWRNSGRQWRHRQPGADRLRRHPAGLILTDANASTIYDAITGTWVLDNDTTDVSNGVDSGSDALEVTVENGFTSVTSADGTVRAGRRCNCRWHRQRFSL